MLAVTAATSLGSILPTRVRAHSENVTLLGGFEDDRNGWKTNGGNTLTRVTKDERPGGVTQGTHALKTAINGDPYPMIENRSRIKRADFVDKPYLVADVLANRVSDTNSNVAFKFRYYHLGTPANDETNDRGKNDSRQKSVLVEESDVITVSPLLPSQLYWDMSHLEDDALANPKRLEIAWYPADYPPKSESKGRGNGFDYRSDVVFDNIRIGDSVTESSVAAIRTKVQNAKIERGPLTETIVASRSDSHEVGEFAFANGSTIPYEFERVDEEKFTYVIDGDSFQLGGGW